MSDKHGHCCCCASHNNNNSHPYISCAECTPCGCCRTPLLNESPDIIHADHDGATGESLVYREAAPLTAEERLRHRLTIENHAFPDWGISDAVEAAWEALRAELDTALAHPAVQAVLTEEGEGDGAP